MATRAKPLTDEEFERLSEVLDRSQGCMNLEMLDGFFAALVCGPEMVLPNEYFPEICGGEMVDEAAVASEEEAKDFLDLIMRHWNVIAHTLNSGEVFLPLMYEDEDGITRGNDWAHGFKRGMDTGHDDWGVLMNDEDNAGSLIAILALHHEHDEDPELRPFKEPVSQEKRQDLIVYSAAGVMQIYCYFAPHRRASVRAERERATFRRTSPKQGRNDPCACGSGRKYKHCCGKVTLH